MQDPWVSSRLLQPGHFRNQRSTWALRVIRGRHPHGVPSLVFCFCRHAPHAPQIPATPSPPSRRLPLSTGPQGELQERIHEAMGTSLPHFRNARSRFLQNLPRGDLRKLYRRKPGSEASSVLVLNYFSSKCSRPDL